MFPNDIKRENVKLYILPHKLKWYQKILQKLHIKNYYKEIKSVVEIKYIGGE